MALVRHIGGGADICNTDIMEGGGVKLLDLGVYHKERVDLKSGIIEGGGVKRLDFGRI